MPIYAPNWIFSRFTTWIFGGVRILLVGQCIFLPLMPLMAQVALIEQQSYLIRKWCKRLENWNLG